jgi:hypothetical protein
MKLIITSFAILFSLCSVAQNVGIGTTTPQSDLHIHSPATSSSTLRLSNNITTDAFNRGSTMRMLGGNLFVENFEPTGSIQLSTGSFDRMTIKNTGQIGINTTDPQTWLHVNGDAVNYEAIRVTGTTPYQSFYDGAALKGYVQAAASGFEIGSKSAQPMNFFTNDVQRMTILNNGNVGINEPNPGNLLTVTGSHNISLVNINNTSTISGSAFTAIVNGAGASFGTSLPKAIVGIGGNAAIGVWGHSSGDGIGVLGNARNGTGGSFAAFQGGTALYARSFGSTILAAEFVGVAINGSAVKSLVRFENTVPSVSGSTFPFAFQVTATGINSITIPNTGHASSSSDLLFIQHKGVVANVNTAVYVQWNGTNWVIYTESGGNIPAGEIYNVIVVKQ